MIKKSFSIKISLNLNPMKIKIMSNFIDKELGLDFEAMNGHLIKKCI